MRHFLSKIYILLLFTFHISAATTLSSAIRQDTFVVKSETLNLAETKSSLKDDQANVDGSAVMSDTDVEHQDDIGGTIYDLITDLTTGNNNYFVQRT